MENIFINNKYTLCYFRIINRAKSRNNINFHTYYERHHIIPRSFYKSNSKTGWLDGNSELDENKVILSGREHLICHLLLTKMTSGQAYYKAVCAANNMSRYKKGQNRCVATGRIYEIIKRVFAEEHSNRLSGVSTGRTDNGLTGHKQSAATIAKRVAKLTGKKRTLTQLKTMSDAQYNRKEKTPEEKILIAKKKSESMKGKNKGVEKSQIHKENLSKSLKGKNKGVAKSEITRDKMRKPKSEEHIQSMRQPKIRVTRLVDRKEMSVNHYTRWVKSLNLVT